jgi:hypothetical protein
LGPSTFRTREYDEWRGNPEEFGFPCDLDNHFIPGGQVFKGCQGFFQKSLKIIVNCKMEGQFLKAFAARRVYPNFGGVGKGQSFFTMEW